MIRSLFFSALAAGGLLLAACAHEPADVSEEPAARADLASAGRALAYNRCGSCHATAEHGDSPNPASPKFRNLGVIYRFDVLETELREGIHVGDANMPQFNFSIDETDALIAYLRSIQSTDSR